MVHPIVGQIIDRDCHVSLSDRAVMRHVITRLKHGYQTFRQMPTEGRKELLRQCRDRHQENRELYIAVMYPNYKPVTEEDGNGS